MNEPLTKEQLEQILDVFTHDGWKYILEDIIYRQSSMSNIQDISTIEELWKRKGELDALNWFASLKEWYQYS